jgi:hypothetical protein
MKNISLAALSLLAATAVALPAAGQNLFYQQHGSADPLQAAYLSGGEAPREKGSIEAKDVNIDQVRWDRVVFRTDDRQRLVHVQLWTKAQTYAQLKARLANPNDPLWDLLDSSGVQKATASSSEMMICNHGAAGVVISFDRQIAASTKVQIAELNSQDNG